MALIRPIASPASMSVYLIQRHLTSGIVRNGSNVSGGTTPLRYCLMNFFFYSRTPVMDTRQTTKAIIK